MVRTDDRDGAGTVTPATEWSLVEQDRYTPDGTVELASAIVFAIADAADRNPTTLTETLLYDCVDVAALEAALFAPGSADKAWHGEGTVEFSYEQFRVEVHSDGWIRVYAPA